MTERGEGIIRDASGQVICWGLRQGALKPWEGSDSAAHPLTLFIDLCTAIKLDGTRESTVDFDLKCCANLSEIWCSHVVCAFMSGRWRLDSQHAWARFLVSEDGCEHARAKELLPTRRWCRRLGVQYLLWFIYQDLLITMPISMITAWLHAANFLVIVVGMSYWTVETLFLLACDMFSCPRLQ
jgi:hypothetical protein